MRTVTEIQMASEPVVLSTTKFVFDVVLIQLVGWPILFLWLWGNAFQRGFFCDDEDLKHPYHVGTVPSWYLYISGLGMNCLVMSLTEYLNRPHDNKEYVFMGFQIPGWMYNVYCTVGVFAFGACCSQLTTDVLKYTIGRLRPHFLTVCDPDVCKNTVQSMVYHMNYTCTNPQFIHDKHIMKEMRLSFPSGHSSFSMYTMLYFAIYLQKRMTWDRSKLLRHTLQFLAVLSALFTAMTRVSDYKHHWSDVLTGIIIGTITACITAGAFSNLFGDDKNQNEAKEITELNNLNGRQAV